MSRSVDPLIIDLPRAWQDDDEIRVVMEYLMLAIAGLRARTGDDNDDVEDLNSNLYSGESRIAVQVKELQSRFRIANEVIESTQSLSRKTRNADLKAQEAIELLTISMRKISSVEKKINAMIEKLETN